MKTCKVQMDISGLIFDFTLLEAIESPANIRVESTDIDYSVDWICGDDDDSMELAEEVFLAAHGPDVKPTRGNLILIVRVVDLVVGC